MPWFQCVIVSSEVGVAVSYQKLRPIWVGSPKEARLTGELAEGANLSDNFDDLSDDDLIDLIIRNQRPSSGKAGSGNKASRQQLMMPVFYEFFAGGGMARAGLGLRWRCSFANEIDQKKASVYSANWGDAELHVEDVANLTVADLPGTADLAWASFPCQDLSLAGAGAGLTGDRSGTFWPFWKLIEALADQARAPTLIVLENVCGTLSSHQGRDFARIAAGFAECGYRFGAFVIDAARFLPQSRRRVFILGARENVPLPRRLFGVPDSRWHPRALVAAFERLDTQVAVRWVWWSMPSPTRSKVAFTDLIEDHPVDVEWRSEAEINKLISMMSRVNLAKVRMAQRTGRRVVGSIYKRTRRDEAGKKVQRAEVRFDNIAGCLRTPVGGSSRQSIMLIEGDHIRSRLLSAREAARLMGLPDDFKLPRNYNEAYHLAGDGVAVPVVRHLAAHLIEPLIEAQAESVSLAVA